MDKAYINEKISKLIPEYMLHGKVIILDKVPLSDNGKIDRKTIKEMMKDGNKK